jgi:phage terminase large subunit-like protein
MTETELMEIFLQSPYLQFEPREDDPDNGDEQTKYINDEFSGIKCVIGGNRSSKTFGTAWLFAKELYTREPPMPNTPVWIVSKTLELAGMIWSQALSLFIPQDQIQHIRWRQSGVYPETIILKKNDKGNNFIIRFLSSEMGREALQTAALFMVWCDEQCPQAVLEELYTRLSNWTHPNCFLYSLTPLKPDSYLSEKYQNRFEPDVSKQWRFYSLNTEKNNFISEEWKENFLTSLSPEQRATRQFGHFANYAGAIYKEMKGHHEVKPFDILSQVNKIYIGIDFGWRFNAAVWIAELNNKYYVFDELQLQEEMTEDFCKAIIAKGYDHRYRCHADYEDPMAMRRMNIGGLSVGNAKKDVFDGIECLRGLFHQDRLLIFNTCKKTLLQLKSYVWEELKEGQTEKQKPKKVNDHLCIAEGQSIDSPNGDIFAENIKVGDLVYSHLGIAEVQDVKCTGVKTCLAIDLTNGNNIQCTLEHPFKTNKGWSDAENLENCILYQRDKKWKLNHILPEMEIMQNVLNMEGINGIVIQKWKEQQTTEIYHILEEQKDTINSFISGFINKYGLIITEQFLMEWYYITLTEIQQTMRLQISNLRLLKIMELCMDYLNEHYWKQQNGMEVKKELNGIKYMEKNVGKMLFPKNINVKFAETNTKVLPTQKVNSVLINAGRNSEDCNTPMMKQEFANGVERIFTQINIQRRNVVPVNVDANGVGVKEITMIDEKPVYSIKTSDGTYFVNGILTSNCDALRYALYSTIKSEVKPWTSTVGDRPIQIVKSQNPLLRGRK